jgi:uncharacterized membrane protein YciS (DUF1049 family)
MAFFVLGFLVGWLFMDVWFLRRRVKKLEESRG